LKEFIRKYRQNPLLSDIYSEYYGGLTPCVFDIETTGLSTQKGSKVILTAMLMPTPDGITVTQYLAEAPYEEDRVLQATWRYFAKSGADFLITYNGASFDVPFVNRRLDALHFPGTLKMYHLDLYSWLKRNTALPGKLSSLRQKSVEKYFQIGSDRVDQISGRESVKLYAEYATSHSSMLEKVILTHNREDVLQLYRLFRRVFAGDAGTYAELLRTEDIHAAQAAYGYPLQPKVALAVRPKISGKNLLLQGSQHCTVKEVQAWEQNLTGEDASIPHKSYYSETVLPYPVNASIFPDSRTPFSAEFRARTEDYRISLPLEQYGKSSYIDLTRLNHRFTEEQNAALAGCSGYVNDYLILMEDGHPRYHDMNIFGGILAENVLRQIRNF
jgi:hypothetical protein